MPTPGHDRPWKLVLQAASLSPLLCRRIGSQREASILSLVRSLTRRLAWISWDRWDGEEGVSGRQAGERKVRKHEIRRQGSTTHNDARERERETREIGISVNEDQTQTFPLLQPFHSLSFPLSSLVHTVSVRARNWFFIKLFGKLWYK